MKYLCEIMNLQGFTFCLVSNFHFLFTAFLLHQQYQTLFVQSVFRETLAGHADIFPHVHSVCCQSARSILTLIVLNVIQWIGLVFGTDMFNHYWKWMITHFGNSCRNWRWKLLWWWAVVKTNQALHRRIRSQTGEHEQCFKLNQEKFDDFFPYEVLTIISRLTILAIICRW